MWKEMLSFRLRTAFRALHRSAPNPHTLYIALCALLCDGASFRNPMRMMLGVERSVPRWLRVLSICASDERDHYAGR